MDGGFGEDCLGQSKTDYGDGGLIKPLFLGPKMKYCLIVDDGGVLSEQNDF